jgi:TRAP transporter TAXI family solute receptor
MISCEEMAWLRTFVFLLASLGWWGCEKRQPVYRFATGSPSTSYYVVGKNIAKIVYRRSGIKLEVLSAPMALGNEKLHLSSINNCRLLLHGKVDFAIAQNNDVPTEVPFGLEERKTYSGIRSLLPLYPEIFFIIYKDSLKPKSLRDLVAGRKVAMGPRDSGTAKITKIIFKEFGVDTTEYTPQYLPHENNILSDSVDISCLITGFDNPRIERSLQRNGRLFSLGSYELADRGSAVDGFCLKYPLAKPYVIPQNTFGNMMPQQPILTTAIDAVLLTREDIPDEVVYHVLKTILENTQTMAAEFNNRLLSQITERFDPLKLRMPLHPAARRYLERDQPSFLERYAETLGFIFSILLATLGGASTFAKWNRQRKKNRIDLYYAAIMKIQSQMEQDLTVEQCNAAIKELKKLRENAFHQLMAEKLSADESFRIFITFLNDTQAELHKRLDALE